jgi:hypothetical protein
MYCFLQPRRSLVKPDYHDAVAAGLDLLSQAALLLIFAVMVWAIAARRRSKRKS